MAKAGPPCIHSSYSVLATHGSSAVFVQQGGRSPILEARKWRLRGHHLPRKGSIEEGLWRMKADTEMGGWGLQPCLSGGGGRGSEFPRHGRSRSNASLSCLHRVQQQPQARCLATFPPMMGCLEAPSRRVSFRYVLGPGLVLCSFHSKPVSSGREGGRERAVSSSSVCHGLNTVVLCWFEPFPSHPLSPPLPKTEEGRNGMERRLLLPVLAFVFFTPASQSDTAAPGQAGGGTASKSAWSCL